MLIEKTTLIQFDDVADRARILKNFEGEQQAALLAVLELMVSGDFLAMARAVVELKPGVPQFLAMPIYDIATELIDRQVLVNRYADGFKVRGAQACLMRMRGIPIGPESAFYPKFEVARAPLAAQA
jgi:hypothetical protein